MMVRDPDYVHAMDAMAGRIRAAIPGNLAEQFRDSGRVAHEDFHPCRPVPSGEVCAVDGSNAILLESGSMAIALFRSAQSTFQNGERVRRSLSSLQFAVIGPGAENEDFTRLYYDCFGEVPGTALGNEDRARTAGILRDTLEYWITEQMAATLPPGALLLRDGPLRVSHASHDPVLTRIEQVCTSRKIALAGVSKRTSATWGGGYPLLPSVSGVADLFGIPAPWWIRIAPQVLDHAQFAQWQHGQLYVACLHPKTRSPLKLELPLSIPESEAGKIMDRLAACSGDGRIPGYPYPLFDAHRTVVLTEEIVDQARSDLVNCMAAAGMKRHTFDILFGDYHDEFARY